MCPSANIISNLIAEKNTGCSSWNAAKHLNRSRQQIPSIKQGNGQCVHSAQDKAYLFAKHLENTFQPLDM